MSDVALLAAGRPVAATFRSRLSRRADEPSGLSAALREEQDCVRLRAYSGGLDRDLVLAGVELERQEHRVLHGFRRGRRGCSGRGRLGLEFNEPRGDVFGLRQEALTAPASGRRIAIS